MRSKSRLRQAQGASKHSLSYGFVGCSGSGCRLTTMSCYDSGHCFFWDETENCLNKKRDRDAMGDIVARSWQMGERLET